MAEKKSTIVVREIHGKNGEAFFDGRTGGLMSYKGELLISERIVSSDESLGEMMAQFASMAAPLKLTGPAENPAPLRLLGPAEESTVLSVSASSGQRAVDVAALEEALKSKSKPKPDGRQKMCTSDKCETRVLGEHKLISEICVFGCRMRYKNALKKGSEKCECASIHDGAHCSGDMEPHSTRSQHCLCAQYHRDAIQRAIEHVNQRVLEKGILASQLDTPSSTSTPVRRPGVTTLTREWQSRVDSDTKKKQLPTSRLDREVKEREVKDSRKTEDDVFYCPSAEESALASMAAGLQANGRTRAEEDCQGYTADFDGCHPEEQQVDPEMLAKIHAQAQAQAQAEAGASVGGSRA